jgi:hypothetical protein
MQKAVQTTLAGGASPCVGHTYERVRIVPAEDGFHEQPQIPREKPAAAECPYPEVGRQGKRLVKQWAGEIIIDRKPTAIVGSRPMGNPGSLEYKHP